VLKRAYFMTECLSELDVRACDKQTRHVSVVTLDWSEIMGSYSTADTVVTDRRTK